MEKNKKTAWEELRETEKEYAAEARSRWGHTEEYKVSEKRGNARTEEEKDNMAAAAQEIFDAFAALRGTAPEAPEVQALVKRWQDHITQYYYPCTREILAGLGQMYVGDERFLANIDRSGEGTAQLMSDAIRIYCA